MLILKHDYEAYYLVLLLSEIGVAGIALVRLSCRREQE